VKGNARLRRVTASSFAGVLAGIVGNEVGAAAGPTAAECISNPKSIDQIVCTIDGAASAAHVCGEVSQSRGGGAVDGLHRADAALPFPPVAAAGAPA
jgi:hypothetical protein